MTAYMYDAAYAPDLNTVRAHGGVAVNHYLTGNYAMTSANMAATIAAELGVVLTYEQGTTELLTAGYAGGKTIAGRIMLAIPNSCPTDGTVAVYVSLDSDLATGQLPDLDDAMHGIRDGLEGRHQLRLYGPGAAIVHCAATGATQGPGWLAGATAWSGWNPGSPNVCLIQMHDTLGNYIGTDIPGTDRNSITDPALIGAWWPDDSPWRETMPTAAEIAAAVWDFGMTGVAPDGKTPTTGAHPAHQWLTGACTAAIHADDQTKTGGIDPATVAAAIAADLGPDLARQVADELHARLAS